MRELPRGWAWATLGEVADVVSGSTPRTADTAYWDGDIPWLTPDDLSRNRSKTISCGARSITQAGYDSCSTRLVPAGTVLYSSRAPIGYVAIAANPVCTNQGFKSFVPSRAVDSDYLYWFLIHATPQIKRLGSGTTFPELSKARAQEVPLPLPPLAGQRRIVAAIEEALSGVEAGLRFVAAAGARLVVLRHVFMSRAVMDGEPKHVGDLLEDIEAGRSFGAASRPADVDEWGVIKVSAMTWGEFRPFENKAVPTEAADPRWEIRDGDLLVSRANTTDYVGAAVLVRQTRRRLLLSDKSLRLIVKGDVDKKWLLYALSAPQTRQQISAAASGTSDSMRNISREKLRAVRLRVPPEARQPTLAAEIDAALSQADAVAQVLRHAAAGASGLRRAILARAFRGELVPQDPGDEPASALLERIAAERAARPAVRRRRAAARA